jgi:hypothetical protein
MTDQNQASAEAAAEPKPIEYRQAPTWQTWVRWGARSVARLWVVVMLAAAAVVSGMTFSLMLESRDRLAELSKEPGPDAYAVLAYRQELQAQLDAAKRNRYPNVTPTPPLRPRLMEEVDIARRRNKDAGQPRTSQSNQPQSRPALARPD